MNKHLLAVVLVVCLLTLLLGAAAGGACGFLAGKWSQGALPRGADAAPETVAAPVDEAQTEEPARVTRSTGGVIDVAKECTKSVVSITITMERTSYNGGSTSASTAEAHGTGVIFREDGYIVTCYHVVEDAKTITVILQDETTCEATLVGKDERFDMAVLHVDEEDLPAATVGDSDAMIAGEQVVVIGNPLGQLGFSISAGVLSAPSRDLTIQGVPLRLMQTDAAINPGNSGGGLFNMDGELVGVVNAKVSASGIEGIGFAIPVNTIRSQMDGLISEGKISEKAFLGVTVKNTTRYEGDKEKKCVEVISMREDGPAEKAGLKEGDLILTFNGKEIQEKDALTREVKYCKPGDSVKLEIIRKGKNKTLTVTLGTA